MLNGYLAAPVPGSAGSCVNGASRSPSQPPLYTTVVQAWASETAPVSVEVCYLI
jgi:hypothetical protein